MAGEPLITIIGSLGQEPELRFTPGGVAVCGISVAVSHRKKNGEKWEDDGTTWYRCTAWRDLAEHVAESLSKGDRVIVSGRFRTREFEYKDGGKGISMDLQIDGIGPELRFATAKVQRAAREQAGSYRQGGSASGAPADDPWGNPPPPQANYGQQETFTGDPWGGKSSAPSDAAGYSDPPPF
jgi:single-strand DNA-binding protein